LSASPVKALRAVRWLLAKDLRILRRSPLMVAVLVLYPAVVAVLIGLALSKGPDRPTVAVVNEIPPSERLIVGGRRVDLTDISGEVGDRVNAVPVSTREEAISMVRDGEALGALIIPRDLIRKLETQLDRPRVEVIVNDEDPLKARLVDDTITSLMADINQRLSRAYTRVNLGYLNLIPRGGPVSALGTRFDVLGLENVARIARRARAALPPGSPERAELARVVRFAVLARQNLDLTDEVLAAIRQPIGVQQSSLSGERVPLDAFAATVAVTLSLAFVTVLLAAGALALERAENAFTRLVRGPASKGVLVAEKVVLAAASASLVTLAMALGLSAFVPLEWSRFPAWIAALVMGAISFAAFGVAIGALARELPSASLLAFGLLLPLAFLALVPSGVVSEALYDLSRAISAAFPFRATIDALDSALHGEGALLAPLLHLAALAVGYAVLARLALRRFA
jgi:ABC-2 type transport system permease protein